MQTLIPETEEGNSVSVVVSAREDQWLNSLPALLAFHLVPKIPDDGKQYVARITWTIGGV